MKKSLKISGDLDHDGDGVIRIYIAANSEHFSGVTSFWGTEEIINRLVAALAGFPSRTPAEVSYSCGSSKSGQFTIRIVTVDNLGHCAAWIQLVAEDEPHANGDFESALICLQVTASEIDEFCHQLRQFKRGRKNEAILSEHER